MNISTIWIFDLPLLLSLLGATISASTDVKWGKIKNYVTIPLILFGWGWGFVNGAMVGIQNIGMSIFVGVLLSMAGKMGEGDLKLAVGIASCLKLFLSIYFVAFLFLTLFLSALWIRLKIYGFKLKPAFSAIKTEAILEMGGIRDANTMIHGDEVRHIGGPVILLALVLTLIYAKMGGLI